MQDEAKTSSSHQLDTGCYLSGNPGPVGYGGAFREERGHWVLGFFGRLENCTSLEAELWSLFRGLEMIQQQGMEAMEVELDSTVAIDLIFGKSPENSPHIVIIQECKALYGNNRMHFEAHAQREEQSGR